MDGKDIDRRRFLGGAAAVGAGVGLWPMVVEGDEGESGRINVAIIGAGARGSVLLRHCVQVGAAGRRFSLQIQAVCDIWEDFALKRTAMIVQRYNPDVAAYLDYREMLDRHKGLDAVIIATPDAFHCEQAIACMEAGLDVYCEMPMACTAEEARRMVATAGKTGRKLQVGYQRRSSPKYIHCRDKIIEEAGLLGRIGIINGQWNRVILHAYGWPKAREICDATLAQFGYDSMEQFRNWRHSRKFCSGLMTNTASQQLDVYNWFLGARATGVLASGGRTYMDPNSFYGCDNVMAVLDYETGDGHVRAYYQTIPMNRGGAYHEVFVGDEGTLIISDASRVGEIHREGVNVSHEEWVKWVDKGYIKAPSSLDYLGRELSWPLYVDESPPPAKMQPYRVPFDPSVSSAACHLENFFDAVCGEGTLNCPGEVGYEALVTALKVNEAIADDGKIEVEADSYEA